MVSFIAILSGALFTLALQVVMSLIGGAVGLSAFQLEAGETPGAGVAWGAGVAAILAVAVAFFLGGYLASGLTEKVNRKMASLHGLAVWAFVVSATVFFLASSGAGLGGLLSRVGIGAGAAATGHLAFEPLLEQMERIRIVTDGELLKAKAVTSFIVQEEKQESPVESALNQAEQELKKAAEAETKQAKDVRQAAGQVREISAAASALAALALLVGLFASLLGARFEFRRRA